MRIFGLDIKKAKKDTADEQRSAPAQIKVQISGFTGLSPTFSALGSDYMESIAYSTAIRTNATYCSKGDFSSVRIAVNGEKIHDYKPLDKLLQHRPNPVNTASEFWERVATFYFHYNNAFVYIEKDAYGEIVALWAIEPSQIQFATIQSTGEIVLRFTLNGTDVIYPYSLMAHFARNVIGKEPLYGAQNACVTRVLSLINTNYQGIENAILTSAYIRFLGESVTKLSDEQLREKSEKFTETYLSLKKGKDPIGIIFSDSAFKLTHVPMNTQKTATYAEMRQFDDVVYNLLDCPKHIIDGTATSEQKATYYERTVSTFFQRVSQELTEKVFTPGEYNHNNRITYADRKLEYYDINTRLQIFNAVKELGGATFGTLFDLLGLPVAKGLRDVVATSQNYQDGKQGGDNKPDGGDGDTGGDGGDGSGKKPNSDDDTKNEGKNPGGK